MVRGRLRGQLFLIYTEQVLPQWLTLAQAQRVVLNKTRPIIDAKPRIDVSFVTISDKNTKSDRAKKTT